MLLLNVPYLFLTFMYIAALLPISQVKTMSMTAFGRNTVYFCPVVTPSAAACAANRKKILDFVDSI